MKREKVLWTGGSSGDRLWCKSGQTGAKWNCVNNSNNLHKP